MLRSDFEGRFSSWTFFKSARQIVTGGAHSRGSVDDDGESMGHGDSDVSYSSYLSTDKNKKIHELCFVDR